MMWNGTKTVILQSVSYEKRLIYLGTLETNTRKHSKTITRISLGIFGALLFINDLEYFGSSNTEFFKNKTLPLLEGLLDWWACYLVKRPCSPAGTHTCPADGWRYDDANDAVRT